MAWGEKRDQLSRSTLPSMRSTRRGLVRDVSAVLADEKISIQNMSTVTDAREGTAHIALRVGRARNRRAEPRADTPQRVAQRGACEAHRLARGRNEHPRPDVVLVDHDLEALKTLVGPLRKEFEFYLTVSPNDALASLARFPIRVLVAGQTLFTGTGLEVLNEAHKRSPATARVLLVSARERRVVEAELRRRGAVLRAETPVHGRAASEKY